nr:hypothetical protein [uncultured Roseateles sp.]
MFADDAATYLEDLGSPVTWQPSVGGPVVAGLMIFDQPGQEMDGGRVITREYKVTFATATWPGLKRDEVLTIGGEGGGSNYKLRTDPLPAEDGVFSAAPLSKVRP